MNTIQQGNIKNALLVINSPATRFPIICGMHKNTLFILNPSEFYYFFNTFVPI